MWLHFQAQVAFQLGRYETAAALLKRRIVRNPDTDASRVLLAASYGQMGRIEEARAGGIPRQPRLFIGTPSQGAAVQKSRRFRVRCGRSPQGGPSRVMRAGMPTS